MKIYIAVQQKGNEWHARSDIGNIWAIEKTLDTCLSVIEHKAKSFWYAWSTYTHPFESKQEYANYVIDVGDTFSHVEAISPSKFYCTLGYYRVVERAATIATFSCPDLKIKVDHDIVPFSNDDFTYYGHSKEFTEKVIKTISCTDLSNLPDPTFKINTRQITTLRLSGQRLNRVFLKIYSPNYFTIEDDYGNVILLHNK